MKPAERRNAEAAVLSAQLKAIRKKHEEFKYINAKVGIDLSKPFDEGGGIGAGL